VLSHQRSRRHPCVCALCNQWTIHLVRYPAEVPAALPRLSSSGYGKGIASICVLSLMTLVAFCYLRRIWFFLYSYRDSDGVLEVRDPVLRKRYSFQLVDVCQYRLSTLVPHLRNPCGTWTQADHAQRENCNSVGGVAGWQDIIAHCVFVPGRPRPDTRVNPPPTYSLISH